MTLKRDGRGRMRDYKTEFERDQSSPEQLQRRSNRNKARRKMGLDVGNKGQVHHKDGNPSNNSRSNLKVMSRKKNTTLSNKKRARKR